MYWEQNTRNRTCILHESGLSSNSEWAMNEEIVDWIALQLPKIIGICNELAITE